MTGIPLSLLGDLVVAGLLVATIVYAALLHRRLGALRRDQTLLSRLVREIDVAAGRAEAGLTALRQASREAAGLHGAVSQSERLREDLRFLVERGELVARQIDERIADSRRAARAATAGVSAPTAAAFPDPAFPDPAFPDPAFPDPAFPHPAPVPPAPRPAAVPPLTTAGAVRPTDSAGGPARPVAVRPAAKAAKPGVAKPGAAKPGAAKSRTPAPASPASASPASASPASASPASGPGEPDGDRRPAASARAPGNGPRPAPIAAQTLIERLRAVR